MREIQTGTLFLVDDHAMLIYGLRNYLENKTSWKVTGMARNIREADSLLQASLPEITIIDVELGEENGFDLADHIRKTFPEIKIIMYSMHEENDYVYRAKQLKIDGYLSKASESEEFIKCIDMVASGHEYIEHRLAQNQNIIDETLDILTNRESQIFKEMIQGKSNDEIGKTLNMSKHSIEVYVTTIYEKTFCTNRSEFLKKFRLPGK